MELPQSRPLGTAQGRKATHDFLSLYTHSSLQQDPKSSHGDFLRTHNFLQSQDGEEKHNPDEENSVDINVKPSQTSPPTSTVDHLPPGGIGKYSISHIPFLSQMVPKPEENVLPVATVTSNDRNDDNSNCSSYTGSGFTLWDESATRKGNTGKENSGSANVVKESTTKVGQWPLDRHTQSSSNYRSSVSPFSSLQAMAQKNQSFMEMIKSAKEPHSMEEEDENLSIKRESSSTQRGEMRVKIDGKSSDQKANTPRSKHSATEQRRRCKINDRFQMLRELIPHSDQKRDKASFLLEVIEYIQFLQEKVNRYEGPYPGWNGEPTKLAPWGNSYGPSESFVNQHRVVNGVPTPVLMFGAKLDEKPTAMPKNIPRNSPTRAECSVTNSIDFKSVDQLSGMASKAVAVSSSQQLDVYAPVVTSCAAELPPTRLPSDGSNSSLSQLHLWQSGSAECEPVAAIEKSKDQELALEDGTININSIYSQGLLNTLTKALQSSGVDLSQASISVQVDVGNRANNRQKDPDPMEKSAEAHRDNQSLLRARVENYSNESDHTLKRLKTG